jgi:hypothetical protein
MHGFLARLFSACNCKHFYTNTPHAKLHLNSLIYIPSETSESGKQTKNRVDVRSKVAKIGQPASKTRVNLGVYIQSIKGVEYI